MSLLLLLLGSQGQHQALGHVLSLGVKGGGLLTPCHSLAQPHGAGCLGTGVESPASLSGGCEDLSGLLTWVVGHMQMARGPWRSTPALTPLPMCGSLGLPGPGMMTHFVAVREMARNETQVTCVLFPGQGWPPHWGCQIPGVGGQAAAAEQASGVGWPGPCVWHTPPPTPLAGCGVLTFSS